MSGCNIILISVTAVFCVICSIFDIRTKTVPNWLLFAGITAALLFQIFFNRALLLQYIITGFCTGFFYFVIRIITHKKLGMADVLFGIIQGLLLTPRFIFFSIIVECIIASCVFTSLQKRGVKNIPFIPFMAFALVISLLIYYFFIIL